MSVPTKQEMSYWFYELCKHDPGELTERSQLMRQAILRLIEASDKGPEVDEGFVQRFVQELCDWAGEERGSWQDAENIVFANLREAGVKVKEEK